MFKLGGPKVGEIVAALTGVHPNYHRAPARSLAVCSTTFDLICQGPFEVSRYHSLSLSLV